MILIERWTRDSIWSLLDIYGQLADLKNEYPNFSTWFSNKVVPDVLGGKRIIVIASDVKSKELIGVMILKNSTEKKICTLRVVAGHRGQGIGTELIKYALDYFDGAHPLVTVPEEHFTEYDKLFKSFGFKEMYAYSGYYRQDKIEHAYNGYLIEDVDWINGKRA